MILDKSKFNLFKVVLSFSIGIFLVYYSLSDFEVELFFESISRANISLIFFSMIILLLSIQFRAIRWKFILNKKIKVNDLYKAQLVGYMGNNIFPLRFGELLKSFYVEKKNNISRYEVLGSVFIERFLDFLGLGFLFLLLLKTNWVDLIDSSYRISLFFIFLASILALLISFYLNRNFENSFINILPSPIKKILVGFSSIQSKNLFLLFVLTILIWCSYILVVYLVQYSFSLNLSYHQTVLLLLISTLALSIPGLPGNIGTFESSVVYTLGMFGIVDNFGFGFILHSVSFIPYTLFGIFYFIKERSVVLK